jgi:hypothetical protein
MRGIKLWLDSKVSEYSYFTNKEYIQDIFSIFYPWLLSKNDKLYIHFPKKEILKYLYIFIYNKRLFEMESCNLIDMTFTSDVVDLYFNIQETFGTVLLEKQNIKTDDILIFLNYITSFYEEEINDEEEIIQQDEILM